MHINIITANVSADFLTPPGVPPWDERKALYAQVLRNAAPDILGFQEATPRQCAFWQAQLPLFTALTVSPTTPDPALRAIWQAKYGRFGFDTIPAPTRSCCSIALSCLRNAQRATGGSRRPPTASRSALATARHA